MPLHDPTSDERNLGMSFAKKPPAAPKTTNAGGSFLLAGAIVPRSLGQLLGCEDSSTDSLAPAVRHAADHAGSKGNGPHSIAIPAGRGGYRFENCTCRDVHTVETMPSSAPAFEHRGSMKFPPARRLDKATGQPYNFKAPRLLPRVQASADRLNHPPSTRMNTSNNCRRPPSPGNYGVQLVV